MNLKIGMHLMPWEIDYVFVLFDRIKSAKYYVSKEDKIYFDVTFNVSSKIIDWDKASLSKEFFVEKFKVLCKFFEGDSGIMFNPKIYDGNDVYGHLDLQREMIQPNIDYYMYLCPDIMFKEDLIVYLLETAKQLTNKYFVITPQIYKCWDDSWDMLVHPLFRNEPNTNCLSEDIQSILYRVNVDKEISKIQGFKFAAWCDLYSKSFIEELVPPRKEWHGYGPWDLYAMTACSKAVSMGADVQQYVLENSVAWFYDTGTLRNKEQYGGDSFVKKFYKSMIPTKVTIKEARQDIDTNLGVYLAMWLNEFKGKL